MKISLNWLQDFITLTETDPQKIADRVTEGMGEVDELIVQGALLRDCVVGKILALKKHPNADKLTLCEVETDRGVKKIVCGGTNLREGMLVAVAHTGATVRWHGTEMMTLEKTKIRGEESEGMICAAEELDLQDMFPEATDHSIIDLEPKLESRNAKPENSSFELRASGFKVGTPLKEALGMSDVVLHIDNHAITHRADLFSHIGVAREFVALGLAKWKKEAESTYSPLKKIKFPKAESPGSPLPFDFKNEIPDLVPRYASALLEVENIGETPVWMKQRLAAVGFRSVSLPVDITNYVAAEVGMPLHSFDADDLQGTVRMRTSKKGEKIVTLDEEERVLPDGAIVISDDEGIFDLLGIMGGLRSSTKETTKHIYLHSACVDPVSIRRAILATGHRTDAATVYEKGIPRSIVEPGFFRALELMLELIPGARVISKMESWGKDLPSPKLTLSLEQVEHVLGTKISEKQIVKILTDLEFDVRNSKGGLAVTPPSHRLGDIHGTHDLVEEIARIVGYNTIEPTMPTGNTTPPKRDHRLKHLREALKGEGFFELLPLSLTDLKSLSRANVDSTHAVHIENPLGEELGVMHTSTLPALLEHLERNYLNSEEIRTFHWGKVCKKENKLIEEHMELTALVALRPTTDIKKEAFLLVKDAVMHGLEKIWGTMGIALGEASPAAAHPGRCAELRRGKDVIGTVFELHPEVRARLDIPKAFAARIGVATIDLTKLLALPSTVRIAKPIPVFPHVTFDENIELGTHKALDAMLHSMKQKSPLLRDVEVVDIFRNASHAPGSCRVTLRYTYGAEDKTLDIKEAESAHKVVMGV